MEQPPPPPGPYPPQEKKPKPRLSPQALVSKFWSKYHSKTPGKVTSIFPRALYETLLPEADAPHPKTRNAAQSYEDARNECREMVRAVVAECERTNSKYSDPDFDIETDFSVQAGNCLFGLVRDWESDSDDEYEHERSPSKATKATKAMRSLGSLKARSRRGSHRPGPGRFDVGECYRGPPPPTPGSVHRLSWVFENPQFTVDGYSSSDIKQGCNGDCWWLAAVATIAHRKDLMDKVCVARDEECGVYGFVFHRDGEWISTVVDDNLYLREKDFGQDSDIYDATGKKARLYKRQKQSGSEALFFAKCEDPNETWLPLLEKAFAKVHGDYEAIDGGWAGTAVEDLTGGVTTVVAGNRVLRKDRLWREMLASGGEDGEFVFGLSASGPGEDIRKNGLVLRHAYSILKATEVENEDGIKFRLVKIRNPWGQRSESGLGEWYGPWSDGSREWTPYMIKKLRHEFGDDGVFWMSYNDVLDNFKWIYRTRLFDKRWTVVQQWTSMKVSWVTGYLKSKFVIEIKEAGRVVIVLSQLDERYFRGLKGQYDFTLQFLLKKSGSSTPLCQVRPVHTWDRRSVNCELELEPGTYEVIPRIAAERFTYRTPVEKVVKKMADKNPQKLRQVGLQYDLAHARGGILDEDDALQKKKAKDKVKKQKQKKKESRIHEMEDAMQRMEMAMVQMRTEMVKGMDHTDHNDRKDHDHQNDNKDDQDKGKKSSEEKTTEEKSANTDEKQPEKQPEKQSGTKPPPGFWPEDSAKTDGGDSKLQPETSTETKDESPSSKSVDKAESSTKEESTKKEDTTTAPRGTPPPAGDKEVVEPDHHEVPDPDAPHDDPPTPPTPAGSHHDSDSDSNSDTESDSGSDLSDSDSDSNAEAPPGPPRPKKKQRWNAVCVLGLRVYAQQTDVKVRLAELESAEEAAALVTSEGKPAGPTS